MYSLAKLMILVDRFIYLEMKDFEKRSKTDEKYKKLHSQCIIPPNLETENSVTNLLLIMLRLMNQKTIKIENKHIFQNEY